MMAIFRVDYYYIWNQFIDSAALFMKLCIWNNFMNYDVEVVTNKFRRNFEIPKTFRVANRNEPHRVKTLMEEHVPNIFLFPKGIYVDTQREQVT